MLNALPAAIFDRRRMLLGLAAASTAAAAPAAVATPSKRVPAEAAELLDLGAKTAFVLANYRKAVAEREAIVAAWSLKWPQPSACIIAHPSAGSRATDLEGNISLNGPHVIERERLVENIAFFSEPQKFRKGTTPQRIAASEETRLRLKAEREAMLRAHDDYTAQCELMRNVSGIIPAQEAEDAARAALLKHVRDVMKHEPATMAGVLIQAEALAALAAVPQVQRITWNGTTFRFSEGYGERIAASLLRIAGNA